MSLEAQIKQKRTEVQTLVNQAKTLHTDLEAQGDKASEADKTRLNNLIDDGEKKRAELMKLERLHEADQHVNGDGQRKSGVTDPPSTNQPQPKSWGRQVTESKAFRDRKERGNDDAPLRVQIKALRESSTANGGAAVFSDRRTEIIDQIRLRPVRLLEVINVSETTSSSVDYIKATGYTNNAAEVAEWDGTNYGLKPESDLTFEEASAVIKTIAHWIRISRNLLMDAPALENLINTKLLDGLEVRLEGQVLNGNGTGQNILGIRNTPGIQSRTMSASAPAGRGQVASDTKATTIRRALTDIALTFLTPDGIVLNPVDSEDLEITEYNGNRYATVYDPVTLRIWRTPIIETQVIPAARAMVGAWRTGATLYMREEGEVRTSENVNDDFIRNALRLLAELRAGLAVTEPEAFEEITFAAA